MTKEDVKQLIREVIQEARIYKGSGDPSGGPTSTEYELTPEEELSLKGMNTRQRQKFATMKLHQARKAKGACIQCGASETRKKPDGTKATYCNTCLQGFRDARNRLVQKRKSCSRCSNPPLPNQKLCQTCTDDLSMLRYKALASGLCLRCKKEPADKNEKGRQTLFCKNCNKEKQEMERKRKLNLNLQNPSQ